tara:strand:+ start:914 stop:1384 length:471 start_codon:yes stop_codon:yes gene_type:complete
MSKGSRSRWSIPTWYLFHGIAEKIDNKFFLENRVKVLNFYRHICGNLPCPVCATHSVNYVKRNNILKIRNKEELIDYFFTMHNWVNKRLKKKIYEKKDLQIYKRINIIHCIKYWDSRFFDKYYVHRNFNSWRRNSIQNVSRQFFVENYEKMFKISK